jgi:hypothetical protein
MYAFNIIASFFQSVSQTQGAAEEIFKLIDEVKI